MSKDRWNPISRAGLAGAFRQPESPSGRQPQSRQPGAQSRRDAVYSRHSNGLEQFLAHISVEPGLTILDLSGASQENIAFITNLGHRISSESLIQSLDSVFGGGDFFENQEDPERVERFLQQNLDFPENHFDGALVWDVLQYLSPGLLKIVVDRLHRSLRPGSYLLAIFHSDERAEMVPSYSYRIGDSGHLLLSPREMRKPGQLFNNRAVERVFQDFESVKFFLTRDNLREVLVKR